MPSVSLFKYEKPYKSCEGGGREKDLGEGSFESSLDMTLGRVWRT
jgi:hypothetical protein